MKEECSEIGKSMREEINNKKNLQCLKNNKEKILYIITGATISGSVGYGISAITGILANNYNWLG